MELINRLPFPAIAFRQFDANGDLDCVVSVRGTFLHRQGEVLALAAEQEEFQWEDAYDGDPHAVPLLRQTDLTPEKVGTDITFLGNAYAPDSVPAKSWHVGLRVGAVSKQLQIHGPRYWQPIIREKWAGFSSREPKRVLAEWQLSETEPVSSIPLCWTKAYGGIIPGTGDLETATPADVEARNPLGCGIVNLDMPPDHTPVPAPQITRPGEKLDWREPSEPQGFGLVSPWWRFRQQYAGTYDDVWLNERHPLLPKNFDPRFWQSAHPDLVAIDGLLGDETYSLAGLHPDIAKAEGQLSGLTLVVHCKDGDRDEWHILSLDGVQFDWRNDSKVMLTWRARFPLQEAIETTMTLTRVRVKPDINSQVEG